MEYEMATPVCVEATRSNTNPVDQIAPPMKPEDVAVNGAVEESAECDRLADERMLHEVEIPDEAGEQRAEAKENADAVGSERIAVRHGVSGEGRPGAHQNTGNDAGDESFARDSLIALSSPYALPSRTTARTPQRKPAPIIITFPLGWRM